MNHKTIHSMLFLTEEFISLIALTVFGDKSVRRCDNVCPQGEKSLFDCTLEHCAANSF